MRNVTLEEVGLSPELSAPEWRQRREQRKWAIERHDSLREKAKGETHKSSAGYSLPPFHSLSCPLPSSYLHHNQQQQW